MQRLFTYHFIVLLTLLSMGASAQVMMEDTTTNQPFFKATKFDSKGYVGFEGTISQILKTKAALVSGISLNWVINHKYVVSAKYYVLTTPVNIQPIVEPAKPTTTVNLTHQSAGLAFSYILFHDKLFSFQPELYGGWGVIKYTAARKDFGVIVPAVYGVYNTTKYFRMGVGLNYRIAVGSALNGLKSGDLNGMGGFVFFRVGMF